MDEKDKVSRIVRKKLEGYFNREIIEREFDPSGAGLHTTTPLVARLELAYMTAVDIPFRNVRKSPSKKCINKKQKESSSRGKDLIPQTQRDTKLKGRAQTKDVLRLAKSSEDALNKMSVLDVINVHRYRSQGVPYEHVSKGKVPHVSHHVHAYLNSEEALRYSQEWDDRKLAQEYKARCNTNRKNKPRRNQANVGSAKYSPRSNTWIDFRNLPLTAPTRDGEYSHNPVRSKEKKLLLPINSSDDLITNQSTVPTDTDSQTSSVRRHYVLKDTGTLPEDGVYPSSSARISESQFPERDSDQPEGIGSDVCDEVNQSQVADVASPAETHPEHNTGESYSDVKGSITSLNSKSQKSVSLSPVSPLGEEKSVHSLQTDSPPSNEQDISRLKKEQASSDEAGIGTESKASHSLSPRSISGREKKRPKTAQQSRSTLRSSADDVNSFHSENEGSRLLSGRTNNDGATPSGLSSVPHLEITNNVDQRFGGSATSIGDASSLLDELSIKSLSLHDTFSSSYSLDFEDDDDGSSEFDNISYNSRSRGRSQNGGISLPNEEYLRSSAMSASPSNQSNRTEEYIRTESVVSLR